MKEPLSHSLGAWLLFACTRGSGRALGAAPTAGGQLGPAAQQGPAGTCSQGGDGTAHPWVWQGPRLGQTGAQKGVLTAASGQGAFAGLGH